MSQREREREREFVLDKERCGGRGSCWVLYIGVHV